MYSAPDAIVRTCRDCGTPLAEDVGATRLYCEADRHRRRALTFARLARIETTAAGRLTSTGELNSVIRGLERVP